MKVKITTSFPKRTVEVDDVFFSSDLHEGHQAVIDFGRKFNSLSEMNTHIVDEINRKVGKSDLLVLMGDSMMKEKDYDRFLSSLICENVIMLYGNHCSLSKMLAVNSSKLIYQGYYLELNIDKQIICCSHYPMFNWNYMEDSSFHLSGHLHGDINPIIDEIRKYKSLDVGLDSYYNIFGEYSIFSFEQIKELLKDKLTIGRHG